MTYFVKYVILYAVQGCSLSFTEERRSLVSKKPILKKKDSGKENEERLRLLFLETALGCDLDEFMDELVPPDNPWWGNRENREDIK